ncbi:hypothetical protein ACROYT_G030907, partial [Oculina patagonica]
MKFASAIFLLVVLFVSVTNATDSCTPSKEYKMIFPEHTTTDYAIKESSIVYDLDAATVCFFAKDTDDNKPSGGHGGDECVYSCKTDEATWGNALSFCTTPTLNVWFDNNE